MYTSFAKQNLGKQDRRAGLRHTRDTGIQWGKVSEGDGSRYRYIGDDAPATQTQNGYSITASNRASSRVALYANGQAVGVTRSSNYASSERSYFGTDLMGTVRSATTDSGSAQYYDYDVFGKPLGENISDFAYTGKPYDPTTGMYNYGYRDYSPSLARFTTVDPIRDGSNWFVYCNNEPVNWVDEWGLCASDGKQTVEVITSGIEVNLITIPDLSTGGLITVTKGFFDASFYINDSKSPDFTARYTYSVTEKSGYEVTILGLSLTAGKGAKTYAKPQTNEQIAKDFENAGTDSVTVGLSVVIGGSTSGSTSGGWNFTQSSLGADGGFAVNVAGGTTHSETKLVEKSLKVKK